MVDSYFRTVLFALILMKPQSPRIISRAIRITDRVGFFLIKPRTLLSPELFLSGSGTNWMAGLLSLFILLKFKLTVG